LLLLNQREGVQLIGVESHEVKLNYYAMAVAILAECSVETAFEKLQSDHPDKVRPQINDEDIIDMRKLKAEGVSWPELGRIYDAPKYTVYGRLRPRKEKVS